jgi:carbamate kinase
VLATDVDRIYLDFGTSKVRGLDEISTEELRRYAAAGQFSPGNMGPKVEAALRFVESVRREVVVCSPDQLPAAVAGRAGTRIVVPTLDQRSLKTFTERFEAPL